MRCEMAYDWISRNPKCTKGGIEKNRIVEKANLELKYIKTSGGLGGAFMNRWIAFFLIVTAACAKASNSGKWIPEAKVLCSDQWFRFVEEKMPTGDGQRHGPDLGSDEWMSGVEFKLGIRDKSDLPSKNSDDWCRYIDQIVRANLSSSDVSKGAESSDDGARAFVRLWQSQGRQYRSHDLSGPGFIGARPKVL